MNSFRDGVALAPLELEASVSVPRSDVSKSVLWHEYSRENGSEAREDSGQFYPEMFATTLRSRRARRKGAVPALRWQSRFLLLSQEKVRLVGAQVDMNALGLSVPRNIARKVRGKKSEDAQQSRDCSLLRIASLKAAQWERGTRLMVSLSDMSAPDGDFNRRVGEILEETGFDPGCLDLIFSEAGLQSYDAETCFTLAALRDRGVGVYVAGFGEGPSSLTLLKERALGGLLDGVQFDCSVLLSAGQLCKKMADVSVLEPVSVAFYHAALQAIRALGLKIRACGVETEEQMAFVRDVGCDEVSGSLFAPLEKDMPSVQRLQGKVRKRRYRVSRVAEVV